MVLIVVEISKEEFQFISELSSTYFHNGVVFNYLNDDVIAFKKTDFKSDNSLSYWKVIEKK